MSTLKEKILAAQDCSSEEIEVPKWGVTIEMRGMSGKSRSRIMGIVMDKDGNVNQDKLYPMLLIACCYDPETNEPIFEDGDEEDILSRSGEILEDLAQHASRLSGIGTEALKEAEKN